MQHQYLLLVASILLNFIAISSSAIALESPRDRLLGLFQAETVIEPLDRYGYPKAVFHSYKDSDMSSGTYGVELCVLEIPASAGRLHVRDIREDRSLKDVYESALSATALGAITGGFFGVDRRGNPIPLGLVKSNGVTVSRRHPWKSGGMIAILDRNVVITPVSAFSDSSQHSDVLQSKPILVESGKEGIRSNGLDRFDRSAVALDSNGNIYFFVIYEPGGNAATLAEFSALILGFRASSGESITHALAMDGGPGAHMYIRPLARHCGIGVPTFVPNILYFSK